MAMEQDGHRVERAKESKREKERDIENKGGHWCDTVDGHFHTAASFEMSENKSKEENGDYFFFPPFNSEFCYGKHLYTIAHVYSFGLGTSSAAYTPLCLRTVEPCMCVRC